MTSGTGEVKGEHWVGKMTSGTGEHWVGRMTSGTGEGGTLGGENDQRDRGCQGGTLGGENN